MKSKDLNRIFAGRKEEMDEAIIKNAKGTTVSFGSTGLVATWNSTNNLWIFTLPNDKKEILQKLTQNVIYTFGAQIKVNSYTYQAFLPMFMAKKSSTGLASIGSSVGLMPSVDALASCYISNVYEVCVKPLVVPENPATLTLYTLFIK